MDVQTCIFTWKFELESLENLIKRNLRCYDMLIVSMKFWISQFSFFIFLITWTSMHIPYIITLAYPIICKCAFLCNISVREGRVVIIKFTNKLGSIGNKNIHISNCWKFRGPLKNVCAKKGNLSISVREIDVNSLIYYEIFEIV